MKGILVLQRIERLNGHHRSLERRCSIRNRSSTNRLLGQRRMEPGFPPSTIDRFLATGELDAASTARESGQYSDICDR
ncbi:hypothetical protein [Actinoallomurus sp. NPDC050550]|uniref:hypothetical protein n=1 Tax=Actinoallomurus sp. NPDC050550 TaxID=3154937 RepID=UPI0033FE9FB0